MKRLIILLLIVGCEETKEQEWGCETYIPSGIDTTNTDYYIIECLPTTISWHNESTCENSGCERRFDPIYDYETNDGNCNSVDSANLLIEMEGQPNYIFNGFVSILYHKDIPQPLPGTCILYRD